MRGLLAVYRKELIVYFYSPIAYVVAVIFLAVSGIFFYNSFMVFNMISMQMMSYGQAEGPLNITEIVMRPYFHNITVILLLLLPAITMRLFAEEKRSGTAELLFTYPLPDLSVVLGKFFAAMTIYILMFIPTVVGPVILAVLSEPEPGPVLLGYLGFFLLGTAFISLGTFISTLSENQVVAAVMTFGIVLLLWLMEWLATFAPQGLQGFFNQIAFITHFENFAKGVLDTRDVVYYVAFTLLFLFLTLRSLETKRWRG